MILEEKLRDIPAVGDIIITDNGAKIIVQSSGSHKYTVVTLEGEIKTSSWNSNLVEMLKEFDITKIIKNDKLKLVEL